MIKNYSVAFLLLFLFSCKNETVETVRLACNIAELEQRPINEFQVIGSHNSYRKRTYAPIFSLLSLASYVLPDEYWLPEGSDPAVEWDYDHVSFDQQFNKYHIRSLEIDIYNDPEGGLFSNRIGKALVGQPIASGELALDEPGLKVMHIPHLDFMTHYLTFKESLSAILKWSNDHPNHFPISVMIELKDIDIPDLFYPFDQAAKDGIAVELLSIFPKDKLIKPSDLRTDSTLELSIKTHGWPTLEESRGKVMFFVQDEAEISETIFGSNSNLVDNDNQIFKVLNDSQDDFNDIKEAVRQGFMVRTRADSGTKQARTGDVSKRDLAIESGAQIISTDYYRPDPRYLFLPNQWSNYSVQWPATNVARSNISTACYLSE